MQETVNNIHKMWALKEIIDVAQAKSQEIFKKNDPESNHLMLEIMQIISDATKKILDMRWTDKSALFWGVVIYSRAIKNL